jgi:hypothetical protein
MGFSLDVVLGAAVQPLCWTKLQRLDVQDNYPDSAKFSFVAVKNADRVSVTMVQRWWNSSKISLMHHTELGET